MRQPKTIFDKAFSALAVVAYGLTFPLLLAILVRLVVLHLNQH